MTWVYYMCNWNLRKVCVGRKGGETDRKVFEKLMTEKNSKCNKNHEHTYLRTLMNSKHDKTHTHTHTQSTTLSNC